MGILHVFLALSVGMCFLGVGIYRAIKHESGNDSWSYKRGAKKGHKFSVAGNVAWAAAGVVCLVAALLIAVNGFFPAVDKILPSDQPTHEPSSTAEPSKQPPSPSPPEPTTQPTHPIVFKTPHKPHGVVCATFRRGPGMGCVVTDHANKGGYGRKDCKILFTVSASGKVGYKQCPRESDLEDLLYGFPFTGKATPYGNTYDMGVASCALSTDYTECTAPDTGAVLLRLNDARSRPKVK